MDGTTRVQGDAGREAGAAVAEAPEMEKIRDAIRLHDAMCWRELQGESVSAALRKFGIGAEMLAEIAYLAETAGKDAIRLTAEVAALRGEVEGAEQEQTRLGVALDVATAEVEAALLRMREPMTLEGGRAARQSLTEWRLRRKRAEIRAATDDPAS